MPTSPGSDIPPSPDLGSDLAFYDATTTTPLQNALALEPLIRQHADFADRERYLHPDIGRAFASSGLYRLAAPASVQGTDASAVTQIAVLEAVSRIDASSGWNLMIGMESFGLIAPSMNQCSDLISDPMTVLASSTAAVGRALREGDGYRVSGRWQFVSGVHNAQLFGATVHLYEESAQSGEERTSKAPCYALVESPHFNILDTWDTVGMRGSGSHDVTVEHVWVPSRQIVASIGRADGKSANLNFPRGARLAYNKVAVALGIARAALDEFRELAMGKQPRFASTTMRERAYVQRTLAQSEARYLGWRAALYTLAAALWRKTDKEVAIAPTELAQFQAVCSEAACGVADMVHDLCGAAGTSANAAQSRLSRIARDASVVRQHVTVAPHQVEDAGRLLLGLEPREIMLRGIEPEG